MVLGGRSVFVIALDARQPSLWTSAIDRVQGVLVCGGRCVPAALLEPVACWSGGYHGMAVWPDPGRLDVARWTLVLRGVPQLV